MYDLDVPEETKSAPHGYEKFQSWLHRQHPSVHFTYKIGLAVAGFLIVVIGLILVPLPGPGWLVVFLGLAVLGLEFSFANRLNSWAKSKVSAGVAWLKSLRKK